MIHRHKKSGKLFRKMGEAFGVEFQEPMVVYTSLEEGQVFVRRAIDFKDKFTYVRNSQDDIVPHGPRARIVFDEPPKVLPKEPHMTPGEMADQIRSASQPEDTEECPSCQ